jgi:Zn-dependent peptidase ImmA (M78 family)
VKRRRWFGRAAALVCDDAGVDDPAAAIRVIARRLIDEAQFVQPPFTPEILASFSGVRDVRRVHMQSAARLVPMGDSGLTIEVNQGHSVGKQNFSIDHEVVHTLLPTYDGSAVDDAETGTFADSSEEELLCDIGAAALLLDDRWLQPVALDAGPSMATLRFLAESFGASLQATARRLAELDLWRCAFVMWEPGFRVADRIHASQSLLPVFDALGPPIPKYRVTVAYASPSFDYAIPRNKSVARSSLVSACGDDGTFTCGVETFDLGRSSVPLYCENLHAPYRANGALRSRVISLLLPYASARPKLNDPAPASVGIL